VFGDLEKVYLAILWSAIWRKRSAILEKTVRRFWRFGEKLFGEIVVDDLEKTFGDFGENHSAILYWSSLLSIVMLGDCMWRLRSNGEKMETNYGDQNFIYHKVESTYLERFKDRNV